VGIKDLRARDLARSIDLAEREPMRSRAREVGERMRAENGIATGTAAMEQIVAG
jgi:class 3 adenylate cyclase